MPKRYFETIELAELNDKLMEQCGSEDPAVVSANALWECPSCQHVQCGADLGETDLNWLETVQAVATKCLSCGFDTADSPDLTELEVGVPVGPNWPIFRPYSPEEAAAYRAAQS